MMKNSGFALLLSLCAVASIATAEPVCTADFSLIKVTGASNTDRRSLQTATPPITVIRQSTNTVQFEVQNTSEHGDADDIFVQYQKDVYGSERCSMYTDVGPVDAADSSTDIITAHCYNAPDGVSMTLVRVYVRSFTVGLLGSATIPQCCEDPSDTLSFSTTEYIYTVQCEPTCDNPDTYVDPVSPTDPPTEPKLPRTSLQEEIIKDMMPASSGQCTGVPMTSTFEFESSQAESQWASPFVQYEEGLFLAKMQHEDSDAKRSWTIRFGQAGNIYSYVGPMGETVPPQDHTNAPWVDEVWQAVQPLGNNGDNDGDSSTDKYFIHEAGTYTKDDPYTNKPFYSPTIGSYCDDASGECGFASWGQQAHLPTIWESPMLYLNRYVNCGNGVFEYTTFRHNILGSGEQFGYLNVPWGGTRRSVLGEIVLSKKSTQELEPLYPIPAWGDGISRALKDTMGFTVFAQPLPKATNSLHDTSYAALLPDGLIFTRNNSPCTLEGAAPGKRFKCGLVAQPEAFGWAPNVADPGLIVRLEGSTTNKSIVAGVRHWEGNGRKTLFFYWTPDLSLSEVNAALAENAPINIYHYYPPTGGIPEEENLAMGHVHGGVNGSGNMPRIRYGAGGRDFNVYTVNDTPQIPSGSSYYYRQYFMMDAYTEMKSKGIEWAPEAIKAVKSNGSITGRTVTLYKSNDGVSFGFAVGSDTCRPAEAVSVCTGSTTPQANTKPLFEIYCGSSHAVTDNLYHFTPNSPDGVKRSYACNGLSTDIRPVWTLLGYFAEDACGAIGTDYQYDADYC